MKVKGDYFVTVIEDTRNQSIIGAGMDIVVRFDLLQSNDLCIFSLFQPHLLLNISLSMTVDW